ncbi:hypothetical protein K0M31_012862 [Melipona bicolor]|uniref:Uncharacterized protein n=1 Tax=Melipona bicolor TaxID=60889 RepID=A0AA40FJC3_9HYME|nr:hypothetical protein K0M31_012862 [Melipona bicolor]
MLEVVDARNSLGTRCKGTFKYVKLKKLYCLKEVELMKKQHKEEKQKQREAARQRKQKEFVKTDLKISAEQTNKLKKKLEKSKRKEDGTRTKKIDPIFEIEATRN